MSQYVRKVAFKNEAGQRIDCLLRTSFFNDLRGLGYADTVNSFNYSDGFFSPVKREIRQSTITGRLSFLNRATAYKAYQTLTEWIAESERQRENGSISLIYAPTRTGGGTPIEYVKDVIFAEITKGEMDTGGFLSCDVTLIGLTPWYSASPLTISFGGTDPDLDSYKRYNYEYDYKYETPNQFVRTINLNTDLNGRLLIEMTGSFDGLVISLYDPNSQLVGMMDLSQSDYPIRAGDTLVYSTMPEDTGVWVVNNGERIDLLNHIAFHDGVEVFFTVPPAENYQIRIRANSGSSTINGTIKAYSYWKTR